MTASRPLGPLHAAAFAVAATATGFALYVINSTRAAFPDGLFTYVGFFVAVFLLIVLPSSRSALGNRFAIFAPLAAGLLFAGLRGNIGTDTYAYRAFFDGRRADIADPFQFEPFFVLLARAVRLLSEDSQVFLFSIAAVSAFVLYLIVRQMEEKRLFLLLYYSTFYITFQFNLLRAGLGVLFALYAFTLAVKRQRAFAIPMALAFGTHYSTMSLVPPIVATQHLRLRYIVAALVAATGVAIAGYTMLSAKWAAYAAEFSDDPTVGLGFLACFALLVAIYAWQDPKWPSRYGLLLALLLATQVGAAYVPILGRVSVILFLVAAGHACTWRLRWRSKVAAYLLVAYGAYATLAFVARSDDAMRSLIAANSGFAVLYGDTHWLPYQTCFDW